MTNDRLHFYTALAGTHGWRGGKPTSGWHMADSPWWRLLAEQDLVMLNPDRPFQWSTDLNGWRSWRRLVGIADWPSDWHAAAQALTYYFWPVTDPTGAHIPIADRTLVVHSHGLQPVLLACGQYGLKIPRLLSVCSPWRRDMHAIAEAARPNIGQWLFVHTERDRWQRWGEGRLLLNSSACPIADWCDNIPGVGHSGLLTDPKHFPYWRDLGYIDFLKGRW
jgi:hypothetical protein